MKKLVAISVLFVILAAAVFAQDDEGKWKFGFMARFTTDLFLAKSQSGKITETGQDTTEFGKFNKGWTQFFGNHELHSWTPLPAPDSRLSLSIANSGEGYDVFADIAVDEWANQWADGTLTVGQFLLNGTPNTDWYAKGTAGIFNAQVGTASYGGWVSTRATWNDWYGWNQLCRFGVWRGNDKDNDYYVSDDFRTWTEWGSVFGVGVALGDNFKVSLGYKLDNAEATGIWEGPTTTKSFINGSFMLNGRVGEGIAFDLFYAIKGHDDNTFARNVGDPDGKWINTIGAYIGIDAIQNLGLSIGYAVNFDAYDKAAREDPNNPGDQRKALPVSWTAPLFSGIDIRLSYSGIDKIGLNFNNNISLAGVKGKGKSTDPLDEVLVDLSGTPIYEGSSQDWFHWDTELKASFAFIENVGLTLHLGNRFGMNTEVNDPSGGTKTTRTATENKFRVSLNANYGIGAVTVGLGLFLGVESSGNKIETTGYTKESNTDVMTFGIPIMFNVAF
jgi:hypothetical protein